MAAGSKGETQIVALMAKLLVSHERQIEDLQDRCSYVFIMRDAEIKRLVLAERQKWVDAAPEDRKVPHPSGASRRVMVWARLIIELGKAAKKQKEKEEAAAKAAGKTEETSCALKWATTMEAITHLESLGGDIIETAVFRLQAVHREPHTDETRPWIWKMVLSAAADPKFVTAIAHLAKFDVKIEGIQVAPSNTKDGPIATAIGDWLKASGHNKGKGRGRGRKGGSTDEGGSGKRQRQD